MCVVFSGSGDGIAKSVLIMVQFKGVKTAVLFEVMAACAINRCKQNEKKAGDTA